MEELLNDEIRKKEFLVTMVVKNGSKLFARMSPEELISTFSKDISAHDAVVILNYLIPGRVYKIIYGIPTKISFLKELATSISFQTVKKRMG